MDKEKYKASRRKALDDEFKEKDRHIIETRPVVRMPLITPDDGVKRYATR